MLAVKDVFSGRRGEVLQSKALGFLTEPDDKNVLRAILLEIYANDENIMLVPTLLAYNDQQQYCDFIRTQQQFLASTTIARIRGMTRVEAHTIQSDLLKLDHVHYFDETALTEKHGHWNLVIDQDITEDQRMAIDNILDGCPHDQTSTFPRGPARIATPSETIPPRYLSNLRTHLPPPPRPNAWNNPLLPAPALNQPPQMTPT